MKDVRVFQADHRQLLQDLSNKEWRQEEIEGDADSIPPHRGLAAGAESQL